MPNPITAAAGGKSCSPMPEKDPITLIGLLATLLLVAGFAMLYLLPEEQPNSVAGNLSPESISPFAELKQDAPQPPPPQAISQPVPGLPDLPALSEEDMQQLTPQERSLYLTLRTSLQQTLQTVQRLEQENAGLQQQLQQGIQANQNLDEQIEVFKGDIQRANSTN